MSNQKLMGLIFANTHDNQVAPLTEKRAMASIPFGGRYRLIDFSVSNMANAEVTKVGVIARQNYMSLMDHVQSGKSHGLARKNGGLFVLPPNVQGVHDIYHGHIVAIHDIYDFLDMAEEDYIVLADADVISNIDIKEMFEAHLKNGADVTIAYKFGKPPVGHGDTMGLQFDDDNFVEEVVLAPESDCNYSLDIAIFSKKHLMNLVEECYAMGLESISKDIYKRLSSVLKIYGYEVKTFTAVIDSMASFFKANMDMLDRKNRKELLQGERTIQTKVLDDPSVIYGLNCNVKNSLIADGCFIDGVVENSVLSRGVRVEKGAVVKNCVLMGGNVIGEGAEVEYVMADKGAGVLENQKMSGTEADVIFLPAKI